MTHSPAEIRALLERAGRSPRRDLGQNFVADPNTVRRIVDLAGVGAGDRVLEIGAGLGSLTLALADAAATVLAVEVDDGLLPVLREVVAGRPTVTVVAGDARHLDWHGLLGEDDWALVANLPYNIATPLVADVLDQVPQVTRMLVMVQHEVGARLTARAGSKQYGAVSVKVAYWASARLVARVPASVFVPRPNVESALVEIVRRPTPDVPSAPLFELVRLAFEQRRKMLRRSLAGVVAPEQFDAAGIASDRRPEQLDLDEWCRLTLAAQT